MGGVWVATWRRDDIYRNEKSIECTLFFFFEVTLRSSCQYKV